MTERDDLKGSPLTMTTNRGLPPDPNEPDPKEELAAWCAYHGIPLREGKTPEGGRQT